MPAARQMRSACSGIVPATSSPKRLHTPSNRPLGTDDLRYSPGFGRPDSRAMALTSSAFPTGANCSDDAVAREIRSVFSTGLGSAST